MRLLKAVGALIALVAVVVGAPIALWVFGRDLLPDHVPTWEEVTGFFTRMDDGSQFLGFLVIVGFILWIVFTGCVLVEIAAVLAGRQGQWRIPGLRLPQRAAAGLIAAIFTGSLMAMSVAPATAAASPVDLAAAVSPAHTSQTMPASRPAQQPERPATHTGGRVEHRTAPTTAAIPHPRSAPQGADPVWTVQRYDTLWSIADKTLGDGRAFTELVDLNVGVGQPDGRALTDAQTPLEIGWQIRLPHRAMLPDTAAGNPAPGASSRVTVKLGDTLSQIAQDQLGAAERYPEIVQANNIADPDVLEIGQVLLIPAAHVPTAPTTAQPPENTTGHREAAAAPHSAERAAAQQRIAAEQQAAQQRATQQHVAAEQRAVKGRAAAEARAAQVRTEQDAAQQRSAAAAADRVAEQRAVTAAQQREAHHRAAEQNAAQGRPPAPPSVSAGPSVGQAAASVAGPVDEAGVDGPVVFAAAGGGLLLSALLGAALMRRRRRQFRYRRPGRSITRTPPAMVRIERAVMSHGDAVGDVDWLDQALRGLLHSGGEGPRAVPAVSAVRQSAERLELLLAHPSTEAPGAWVSEENGRVWSLRRDDPTGYRAELRGSRFAPYPMLVSVGHTADGERWLLDLEQAGAVLLGGDGPRCEDLARFIAAELAHNSWSEMLRVTLCGFGAEMGELAPERIRHVPTATAAVEVLREQVSTVAPGEVMQVRGGDGRVEPWTPQVVLVSAAAATADRAGVTALLAEIAACGDRTAVALVLNPAGGEGTGDGSALRVRVDAGGRLEIPALSVSMMAERLPVDEARDLTRLLALSSSVQDQDVPASRGENPWDEFTDVAGAIAGDRVRPDLDQPLSVAGARVAAGVSVLAKPTGAYVAAAATTAQDVRALAPQVPAATAAHILSVSDTLDVDVARWYSQDCAQPRVRLLGQVDVRAQGALPADKPRLAWNTEVVAFLACRGRGATAGEYGAAMWPDEADIEGKTKVRQSISIARLWLGRNPETGSDHIPSRPGVAAIYRLEGALVDAELFRRLRIRGVARGPEGITDLETALQLVTGPPFDRVRPRRYRWLADTPLHHEYSAMIVDVAHTVACHHLAVGDPERAAAAAKVSLLAGCLDDTPRLDLVKACYLRGLEGEAQRWIREILTAHNAEDIEEELPARTYEIMLREGWLRAG